MNFCSHCGSDKLVYKIPDGDHLPRFVCSACKRIHYQNPNMVVGCIIENEGRVMLCRRGIEPRKGYWNLPCGFLENDETIEQGAKREVYEETGASVKLNYLHTVYNLPHANQVYLIFHAEMLSGHYQTTHESTEIEFFPLDKIPWDEIAFSSNSFAIEHLIKLTDQETNEKLAIGSYFKDRIR